MVERRGVEAELRRAGDRFTTWESSTTLLPGIDALSVRVTRPAAA